MRSQYKAVIPAAGLGTRFLPATKAMPKEMLPVVDKPAIQYVVEEAVAAGIRDVLIIVGRNKSAIDNHFDSVPELERALENKGDVVKLDAVSRASQLADIHLTRQGEPRGLGHAVGRAESYVGDSPFVVMLGDDLIDARDDLLTRMLDVHERTGGAVVALMPVAAEQVHLYGVATIAAEQVHLYGVATIAADAGEGVDAGDPAVRVADLVEKPSRDDAPSNLAVIGRYVLPPAVFDVLARTAPGKGGEIQLTDALRVLASDPDGPGVYGVVFDGRRYDTGDRVDYIKAILQLAVDRDDLGPALRPWLKGFAADLAPQEALLAR